MTVRDAIARLLEGESLSEEEAATVIGDVMDGEATPAQIGALLALLRRKGETVEELAGAGELDGEALASLLDDGLAEVTRGRAHLPRS